MEFRSLLKDFAASFLDLIYPPLCLHCDETLESGCKIFCRSCLEMMEMIDPLTRCSLCFSSDLDREKENKCQGCRKNPRNISHIASVFDYEGPAATLVKQLKYGGQSYLAKGGGAYLAAQFLTLGWPIPDFILPMPMAPLRRWERGYNQSMLLAQTFSQLIQCPVSTLLKRKNGDFSQAGLDYQQRLSLQSDSFFLKKGEDFFDRNLLLIDDVMTTGSSLNCCAEALTPFFPKSIYALTLCRTL